MKMRKIMAAGIAATMAVTSLAAVASAEAQTLTFDMKQSTGSIKTTGSAGTEYGSTAGINVTLAAAAAVSTSVSTGGYKTVVNGDGQLLFIGVNTVCLGEWIFDQDFAKALNLSDDVKKAIIDESKTIADAPTLTVKGLKIVDENKSVEATASFAFKKFYSLEDTPDFDDASKWTTNDNGKSWTYGLVINEKEGNLNEFVASQWARIDSIKVDTSATYSTTYQVFYEIFPGWTKGLGKPFSGVASTEGMNDFAKLVGENVNKIGGLDYAEQSLTDKYALLQQTAKDNQTIYRADVKLLSDTGAHASWSDVGHDTDQTYDDNGLGTSKNRFAGLASQVADFFNHKTNGTITFKFTLGEAAGNTWVNGGVPSTQVGIKNILNANNFALYVNYQSSTGSLEATTSVDKEAGTVTFDISEILADLGGQTKGVVTDLYYGLNQGIQYGWPYLAYNNAWNDGRGLLVEEVTLAYEDDAADEEDVIDEDVPAEDEDEDEDVVVDEEEDEDEDVAVDEDEDEDEDVTVDEDEDEDEDEDIGGDMIDDEPTADDEEDANPGTGVALAVVPALVAAAAVVVSKKRK